MPTRLRKIKKPVPTLHLIMILSAVGLVSLSMMFHYLQPLDTFWVATCTSLLGFLFGKFTNGFASPATPADERASEKEEKEER